MASSINDSQAEVRSILWLVNRDPLRAFQMIQSQLSVLVLRTQVMLSLSGIVITVTGFSGRSIAQTSQLARALVAAGIVIVLCAAATAIGGVLSLRWLTQELTEDVELTVTRMLAVRDAKSKFLSAALTLFVIGFACYCVAIALMLVSVAPVAT
jgi:hypothetical protein